MLDHVKDSWHAGGTYELFMGRWSRPLAEEFIKWLGPPPGWHWLDVGTGTGAVAAAICALAQPMSVLGCDPSLAFIESARSRLKDARARFEVTGTENLPVRDGGYDAVVSGLALNFFAEPRRALEEQLKAVRPGGCISAFVWDYAEGMEFLRYFWDAAVTVDARAAELDERRRFSICTPDSLEALFRSIGAERVRTGQVRVPTVFADFDDYWRPFLGGTGPAPSLVAVLSEGQRAMLAASLRNRLPSTPNEPIVLSARAWAVVGTRPESHRAI